MDVKLQKKIMDRCPNLYRGKDLPITQCLIPFGIETGDGWFNLLYDLSKKLETLIMVMEPEERECCYAMQVKEKYGTLSFSVLLYNDEVFDLIEQAETDSATICEICGGFGELYVRYGWYNTLCEKCNNDGPGGRPVNEINTGECK